MAEVVNERRCLICDERVWWGIDGWDDHDHSKDEWSGVARSHESGDHRECRSGACDEQPPMTGPDHQAVVAHGRSASYQRGCRCERWCALADEARLVSQWADSLDPMPEELRGELRNLGTSARRLLEGPVA